MPITYVKDSPPFERRYDDALPEHSVLFFDPALEHSRTPLTYRFRQIDAVLRSSADLIVFRGSSADFLDRLENEPALRDVIGPVPVLALVPTVVPGPRGTSAAAMDLLRPVWCKTDVFKPPLDVLRETELRALLQGSDAIFSGSGEHHFVLPSGYHAKHFIRFADALRDHVDVTRLADWILPHVPRHSAVIADTGSMLPLLLTIQRAAWERHHSNITIESVGEYPGDAQALSDLMTDLPAGQRQDQPRVLLISVNSSGRLARIFRSLSEDAGEPTVSEDGVIVLCDVEPMEKSEGDRATVFMAHTIDRWYPDASGKCEECHRSPLMQIDRRTYERLPSDAHALVAVDHNAASKRKAFWEALDQTQAIRLHANVEYRFNRQVGSRHLGIYIDAAKLLQHPGFRACCVSALRDIAHPIDCVLIPQNASSAAMRDLVLEAYSNAETPLRPGRIYFVEGRLSGEVIQSVNEAAHVLIADDALVHGTTIVGLRLQVYNKTQHNPNAPKVHAFVAVARPPNAETLKSVRRPLTNDDGPQLKYGEKLLLPSGHGRDRGCPWCDEFDFLGQYVESLEGDAAQYARDRLARLRGGDLTPPFLLSTDLTAASTQHAEQIVTRDSFFGTLSPITAFAAGVSAAQEVRTLIEDSKWQLVRKVADIKFLVDAYFETIILAPMLRTLTEVEVRCAARQGQIAEAIGNLDPDLALPGMLAELGYAAVHNKLPQRAVYDLLEKCEPDPAILMLKAMLRYQIEP